jgi:phosphatidylinositol alpha 1,6-mannosyltransferase
VSDARALRLALFTDTFAPQVNGVARTLERLVSAVERRGGAVHVETVRAPGASIDPRVCRTTSVPFWAYPQLRIAVPSARRVAERLVRFGPSLIHSTTPFGVGLAGRAAASALAVPFVTSYHTSFAHYLAHYGLSALDQVAWPWLRWFHNSGRRTFVPTHSVAEELAGRGFTGLRLWSRGVDTERFTPRARSRTMRARMGAHDGTFVVAYVGRLAPEKGIETAIEAMRLVLARHGARVRFVLAGDGPAEARCRAAAPDGTWFAGALSGDELSRFYASADAFIFPSATETFGNVVLEAMASGLAVIAPDRGATTEIARDGTALTFPAGDPHALAGRVEWLMRDARLWHSLCGAGLAEAKRRSWDAVWDQLVDDYREAAGRGAPTADPVRSAA